MTARNMGKTMAPKQTNITSTKTTIIMTNNNQPHSLIFLTAGTDHTFPEQFYVTAKCSTMKSSTSTTKKNEKHHTTARSKERTGAHGDKHSSHQLHTYHHGTFTEYQHLTIEALRCKKQQTPELHKTNWIISGHSAITTIHRDQ
jgi:hypothetical protein